MIRRLSFNVLLMMAALAVGVLALEGMARLLMPQWRDFSSGRFLTLVDVPGRGTTSIGTPGFDGWFSQNNGDFRARIRINAFGLRNDEPVAAADGRIWILGDSFSFGWGVEREESYTQVLADRLGFPAYNVATPGSNVCGWQALYARMPTDLRPVAVVVGLTIENRVAVLDCPAAAKVVVKAEEPNAISLLAIKASLTRHTALYNVISVSLKRINVIETILTKAGLIEDPARIIFHGHDPAKADEMIAATTAELDRLRAMTPKNIPFVVVLFPARFELRDDTGHFRRLRTGMAEALARHGIAVLDLYPEFKAAGLEATHFAHDGHWNPRGHRIAGEALARWFAARPPLSPPQPANHEKRP